MRPKIRHATRAQIEAVLPADIRNRPPIDASAVARMDRILSLSNGFALSDSYSWQREGTQSYSYGETTPGPHRNLTELTEATTPFAQRLKVAKAVWEENSEAFAEVSRILDLGPLQFRPDQDFDADQGNVIKIRDLVRCLSMVGSTHAMAGDFATAKLAIDLANRVAIAVEYAGGDSMVYAASITVLTARDHGMLEAALARNCPTDLCRQWLQGLSSDRVEPKALGLATAQDFREGMLPLIENTDKLFKALTEVLLLDVVPGGPDVEESHENYQGYGTYDPVLTAKLMGRFVERAVENANSTTGMYVGGSFKLVAPETQDAPDYGGLGMNPGWRLTWEKFRFRFLMSNGKNTLGRALMQIGGIPDFSMFTTIRCAYRARHAELQLAVASVMYRHDHGGKLPYSLSELAPKYLAVLPVDPFRGKPVLYDRSHARLQCSPSPPASSDDESISKLVDLKAPEISLEPPPF